MPQASEKRAMCKKKYRNILLRDQRTTTVRIVSVYRRGSTYAILIIVMMRPIPVAKRKLKENGGSRKKHILLHCTNDKMSGG